MTDQLEHKEYIGDGVYVGYDGYHIVLFLQDTGAYGLNAIALEPSVLGALNEYAEKLSRHQGGQDGE